MHVSAGRASGIIIDTSASFALTSPFGSSSAEQKYPLVKFAVEAFDGNLKGGITA